MEGGVASLPLQFCAKPCRVKFVSSLMFFHGTVCFNTCTQSTLQDLDNGKELRSMVVKVHGRTGSVSGG